MNRFREILLVAFCLMTVNLCVAQGQEAASADAEKAAAPDQAALERGFQEMLAGTALKGFFTELNQKSIEELMPDSYRIDKVIHQDNGLWFFDAKVQYRGHDIAFRLPIKVEWAGPTPVMIIDKMPMPGLGTFTARVMFFDGLYAGTWEGHDFRGHMYGEVVKQEDLEEESKETPAGDAAEATDGE